MNRKNNSAGMKFKPAMIAVLVCTIICGMGLGYVWQKSQISDLGKQMKERESLLDETRRTNKKLGDELSQLKAPAMLHQMVQRWQLDLSLPNPRSVVVLTEKQPEPLIRRTVKR